MEITRAISVRQPFAELIMQGVKTEEYRTISTNIRERIYIYASKTLVDDEGSIKRTKKSINELPLGVLIGSIDLIACSGSKDKGFIWKLANPVRLKTSLKPNNKPQPVWFKPF